MCSDELSVAGLGITAGLVSLRVGRSFGFVVLMCWIGGRSLGGGSCGVGLQRFRWLRAVPRWLGGSYEWWDDTAA
jgi:hypothetical protein